MTDRTGPRQCLPNQQGNERTFNYLSHLALYLCHVIFVASTQKPLSQENKATKVGKHRLSPLWGLMTVD